MKMKKIYILSAAILGIFLGASTAYAWNGVWYGPSAAPPAGNVDGPINIGGSTQTKAGVFNAYGIRSYVDSVTDADAYATAFYYNSDRSLKDDVLPLSDSLSKVLSLQGVAFRWKDSGKKGVGLIAQDVQRIYPDVVTKNPSTGLLSVEYGNLVAPLIEAIKAQQKEIEALKAELEALKANN